MSAAVSQTWKLLLTIALLGAILASVTIRAPRVAADRGVLFRLVLAAIALYLVGVLASLSRHQLLAGSLYAGGILACSLAVWLSRGVSREDGTDGGDHRGPPDDGGPPPDDVPGFDWDAFERELAALSERRSVRA